MMQIKAGNIKDWQQSTKNGKKGFCPEYFGGWFLLV